MKKIELHVHLDGSVRPSTVSEITGINLNEIKKKMVVGNDNSNLAEYLTKFELPISIMQTKENLIRVSKELAEDLKKDDVIYAEVRFAPMFHIKKGLTYDEVINSVIVGLNKVMGIKINLLLCMMRGASFKDNLNTINCAYKYLNKGVVGIDLAGDEKKYKTKDYKELFDYANKKKIPFTIHAGEADGPTSIYDAVKFGAKRIGHGIRILENSDVLNYVISNNITLEICPTSNLQTKLINKYNDHPIRQLYDKGVLVTINTDNNTVSNITLGEEYNKIKKYFNFTEDDFLKMNINAINASFISNEEKKHYINELKRK